VTDRRIPQSLGTGSLFLGILAFSLAVCSGCANLSHELIASSDGPEASQNEASPEKLTSAGTSLLQSLLNGASLSDLQRPDFSEYQTEAKEFYEAFDEGLPWVHQRKPTPQALAMMRALDDAEYEGLRPEDYDASRWDARLGRIENSKAQEPDFVRFDLALTICAMRYVSDLHVGRVNPRFYHYDLEIAHTKFDLSDFLAQKLVRAEDVHSVLGSVEPPFPLYRRTKAALKTYLDLAEKDRGESLPMPSKPLKPGDSYAGAARLAQFLALVRDIPVEEQHDNGFYGSDLANGVKHFQQRHGLEPNGLLDAGTVKEINTPLNQRVMQLELTMERLRWLPHEFERPPVVVNIPEFRLRATDEQFHWVLSMGVVVGKAYGHQTPVFSSEIRSVIFRPYWSVPYSITRAEMLPHVKKDARYLADNDYQIVTSAGDVVSDGLVNAEIEKQLRSGTLQIRQKPGAKDSLGKIKFNIPSSYDVYLHDTPARTLFSKSRRDFSHGCIRVEKPAELAEWAMRDMLEWTEERIEDSMNGDKTFEVKLKHPIPVLILYGTAVVMEDGEVHFLPDIYKQDADLERALFGED
jgi:murein L,D-transpeptidase YcbB/YkuD